MVNISQSNQNLSEPDRGGFGLLLIDLQERLAPAIPDSPLVSDRAIRLVEAANSVAVPVLATEQYPKGLGPTVGRIRCHLDPTRIIEKIHFAAPREAAFRRAAAARGISEFAVAGTEAHVCVLQSVLCLLREGYRVSLIADAVASRVDLSRETALQRMAAAGAALTKTETVVTRLAAMPTAQEVG